MTKVCYAARAIKDGVYRHGPGSEALRTACIAAGLPVIDSRKAPFHAIARVSLLGP